MTRRLKVLVSAYACEPGRGSEPGVGWNWVRQIARFHDVWVITRANNRGPIEVALAEQPLPNVHWVYYDLPPWARFWKRGGRGVQLYYYLWQIGIYSVATRLHAQICFDLAHHVTFGNYWIPSFLPFLSLPFIWGPLGGGESAPKSFYGTFSCRGRMYEHVRDSIRWVARWDPFVRLDARRASVALAKARETMVSLRELGGKHLELYSEAGISTEEFSKLSSLPIRKGDPIRYISVGRLLHLKGYHLGLMAFALLQGNVPHSEYWLIGEGPERRRLQLLAHDLGLGEKVRFWGSMPRAQVLQLLAEANVLVHPSLHDSGGWVCLEAMAAGRPVICLDLGGPALQVTPDTGIKVPAVSPEQAVQDLATAMQRLAQDAGLREQMSQAARHHVNEHFRWSDKGEWMREIYRSVT